MKEGAQTTLQLADLTLFALKSRPLELDPKTKGLLTDETRAVLGRLRNHVATSPWEVPALEAAIRGFAGSEGIGIGKFGAALRGVLSGGAPAPDLASALVALGKDEALGRIDDALSQVQ